MAQLSKYQMDRDLQQRMFDIFYQALADLSTKQAIQAFLFDLLSQSEQIMLAKRLAIAVLLVKGETYESIRELLKVSTSTIVTVRHWLDSHGEGYKKAIEKLLRSESIEIFIDKAEVLIESITIPRPGSNWSKARSNSWKLRAKRQKARIL